MLTVSSEATFNRFVRCTRREQLSEKVVELFLTFFVIKSQILTRFTITSADCTTGSPMDDPQV